MNTTTRLTSPEPTGLAKYFQDEWDARRETQVNSYIKVPVSRAIDGFYKCVVDTINTHKDDTYDALAMYGVYGSYDYTDFDISSGRANSDISVFMTRLGRSTKCPLTKILKKAKMYVVVSGIRTTGTIQYTDGTMDVVSPVTGRMACPTKTIESIKPIDTLYCVLAHSK